MQPCSATASNEELARKSVGVAAVRFAFLLDVRSLFLVSSHVTGIVDDLFATADALPFAIIVESLLVTPCVLGRVRQAIHGSRFHRFLFTIDTIIRARDSTLFSSARLEHRKSCSSLNLFHFNAEIRQQKMTRVLQPQRLN